VDKLVKQAENVYGSVEVCSHLLVSHKMILFNTQNLWHHVKQYSAHTLFVGYILDPRRASYSLAAAAKAIHFCHAVLPRQLIEKHWIIHQKYIHEMEQQDQNEVDMVNVLIDEWVLVFLLMEINPGNQSIQITFISWSKIAESMNAGKLDLNFWSMFDGILGAPITDLGGNR
jgi:hypothetical protein